MSASTSKRRSRTSGGRSFARSKPRPSPRTAPLRRMSDRRREEMALYKRLRLAFFRCHQHCQFPGCRRWAWDIHHMRGRRHGMLNRIEFWMTVCRDHHEWIHRNPAQAASMGLLHLQSWSGEAAGQTAEDASKMAHEIRGVAEGLPPLSGAGAGPGSPAEAHAPDARAAGGQRAVDGDAPGCPMDQRGVIEVDVG